MEDMASFISASGLCFTMAMLQGFTLYKMLDWTKKTQSQQHLFK
jgi:hypothetical protein